MNVCGGLLTLVLGCSQIHDRPKGLATFTSTDGGFAVAYPQSWVVYQDSAKRTGMFDITNFPVKNRVKGVFLPTGGAEITLSQLRDSNLSVDGWVALMLRDDIELERKTVDLPGNPNGHARRYTEITWLSEVGPKAYFFNRAAFFLVRDTPFQARLTCWNDDLKAESYTAIFRAIIESFTLLPASKKA
jgi:hypothetical protein